MKSKKISVDKIKIFLKAVFNTEKMCNSVSVKLKFKSSLQKDEFCNLFIDLVLLSYQEKLNKISTTRIDYYREKIFKNKAIVYTRLDYKGKQYTLDYRLLLQNNSWKVYDLIIENISLLSTYRSQFSSLSRKKSVQSIIILLRNKISKKKS